MGQYKQISIKGKNSTTNTEPRSQVYRGVSTINQNSKSFALYDTELVKQDILNHFNIRKGEKIYNPDFGSIVWDVIHEPLTEGTRNAIFNDIESVLGADPRINVLTIDLVEREYGMQIALEIEFKDYAQVEKMIYTFDRESGISTV